jgi:hypothetical protein
LERAPDSPLESYLSSSVPRLHTWGLTNQIIRSTLSPH